MSASQKVLKSAFILLSIQIINKGLGVVSTIILARLLLPEHFGLIAIIVIAIQFFEILVEVGTQQYIVQKPDLTEDDLNTAWTMDVLTKSGLAVLIFVSAPQITAFFNSPEAAFPLIISALVLPLRALKTPGLMKLAREINYQPVFKLTLWQKGISFISVIGFAIYQPDHWAIIVGNLVSAAILCIGSYLIHPFRPKWTLIHIKKQWLFSQWLLLRGIVGFLRSQIDNLLVSKIFGTSQLGGYNLVREIGLLPAVTFINPMLEPLLAAIAQGREDPQALSFRVRTSIWLTVTLIVPITTFIMAYPELIIGVLLGSTWSEYAHLLQPFGLSFFSFCLFALLCDAMIAQGKVRLLFILDVVSTSLILIALLATATSSLSDMAWIRGGLAIATVAVYLLVLNHQVKFDLFRLAILCVPVLVGSACGLYLSQLQLFDFSNILASFIAKGVIHVLVSGTVTLLVFYLCFNGSREWHLVDSLYKNIKDKLPILK